MKKTILLSSLFAAAAAVAGEVPSGNAIAALDKEIGNSAAQTLLAVPFEGYEETGKVKVEDIVKTSGLAKDSKLYVPNRAGGYDTWTLDENGQWKPGVKVTIGENGEVGAEVTGSASDVEINRGDAFWLEPVFASGNTGKVFLLGQGNGTSGTSTVASGWNLVGNASADEVSLAGLTSADLDQIIVQKEGKLRYYTYKSSKGGWRYQKGTAWSVPADEPLKIAPGQGFWYKSATAKSIDWTNKTQN